MIPSCAQTAWIHSLKSFALLGSVGFDVKTRIPLGSLLVWDPGDAVVTGTRVNQSLLELPSSSPAWIWLSPIHLGIISSSFAA